MSNLFFFNLLTLSVTRTLQTAWENPETSLNSIFGLSTFRLLRI